MNAKNKDKLIASLAKARVASSAKRAKVKAVKKIKKRKEEDELDKILADDLEERKKKANISKANQKDSSEAKKDEEIEKLKNQIKNMTLQDVIKKKPLETIEEKEEVRESVVDTVKKPKAVMEEPKQIPIVPKVEHIIKK